MTTATKRHKTTTRHYAPRTNGHAAKLPKSVVQQLEKIYWKSQKQVTKQVTKHPYKTTAGVLLSVGLVSGAFILMRYLRY